MPWIAALVWGGFDVGSARRANGRETLPFPFFFPSFFFVFFSELFFVDLVLIFRRGKHSMICLVRR